MPEKILFRGVQVSVYPGHKGSSYSSGANISTYREGVTMSRDGRTIRDSWLEFDIERLYTWNNEYQLQSFTYSMMINGLYPISRFGWLGVKSHPTREEFMELVSQLSGFVLDEEVSIRFGFLTYRNPHRNIFVNWTGESNTLPKTKRDRIGIGVIQEKPVPDLQTVTDEIVPYAVAVFNKLSLIRQITPSVVEQAIRFAVEGNKIIPRYRGSRNS